MKTVKSKLSISTMAIISLVFFGIVSCSKSSSGGGGTTPPPVTLLGGYASSDSVASAALVAYWPFEGNSNETKMGLTATANGVTYVSGIRGMAYQGDSGSYATLAIPSADTATLANLASYSVSFWYYLPAQPYDTLGVNDPGGIFFMGGTNTPNELIYEFEHYTTGNDSVNFHNGFDNLGAPAGAYGGFTMAAWDTLGVGQWIHLVTTYNDTSSTYVVYEDGNPITNASAWGYALSNILYQEQAQTIPEGPISFSTDEPVSFTIGTWPAGLYGVSATLGLHGWFLGKLDELRLFKIALTQQQITGLYLNGLAGR
jgi:hypothetical protein